MVRRGAGDEAVLRCLLPPLVFPEVVGLMLLRTGDTWAVAGVVVYVTRLRPLGIASTDVVLVFFRPGGKM